MQKKYKLIKQWKHSKKRWDKLEKFVLFNSKNKPNKPNNILEYEVIEEIFSSKYLVAIIYN